MTVPLEVWVAGMGAVACGLAYHLFVLMPSQEDRRLEGAVRAFGRAVELRFPNHAGLTDVVSKLARRVASRLGMRPARVRRVEMAARLRDLGLCAIPYRLVNRRPWNDWTLGETATYDCHPEVGGAILETIPSLAEYAEAVRRHHAPFVPPEDAADRRSPPVEARIVKACAEYVWYSRHLGHDAALKHIRSGIGTLYDPLVAHELLRIVRREDDAAFALAATAVHAKLNP